jgi:hypothetical protein
VKILWVTYWLLGRLAYLSLCRFWAAGLWKLPNAPWSPGGRRPGKGYCKPDSPWYLAQGFIEDWNGFRPGKAPEIKGYWSFLKAKLYKFNGNSDLRALISKPPWGQASSSQKRESILIWSGAEISPAQSSAIVQLLFDQNKTIQILKGNTLPLPRGKAFAPYRLVPKAVPDPRANHAVKNRKTYWLISSTWPICLLLNADVNLTFSYLLCRALAKHLGVLRYINWINTAAEKKIWLNYTEILKKC